MRSVYVALSLAVGCAPVPDARPRPIAIPMPTATAAAAAPAPASVTCGYGDLKRCLVSCAAIDPEGCNNLGATLETTTTTSEDESQNVANARAAYAEACADGAVAGCVNLDRVGWPNGRPSEDRLRRSPRADRVVDVNFARRLCREKHEAWCGWLHDRGVSP